MNLDPAGNSSGKKVKKPEKMSDNKCIIGLLGAPGSGKSSVAKQLQQLGCAIIHADVINHELLRCPAIIERVTNIFGHAVLSSDGQIDRKCLGNIVFADPLAMKKLTDLLHPLVLQEEKQQIEIYQQDSGTKAIVLDVPLLIETGQDKWCHTLIYVDADKEVRENRLSNSHGWDSEKIKNVEKAQLALDIKAQIPDYTLYNNSSIPDLAQQTANVLSQILEQQDFSERPQRK